MLNRIYAGQQGGHHAGFTVRMSRHFATHGVGSLYQRDLLFIGKLLFSAGGCQTEHSAGRYIFNVISTVFHLRADGLPALRHAIAHSGVRMRKYVVAKSASVAMTTGRCDSLTGRFDAWPHDNALIDGITQSKMAFLVPPTFRIVVKPARSVRIPNS